MPSTLAKVRAVVKARVKAKVKEKAKEKERAKEKEKERVGTEMMTTLSLPLGDGEDPEAVAEKVKAAEEAEGGPGGAVDLTAGRVPVPITLGVKKVKALPTETIMPCVGRYETVYNVHMGSNAGIPTTVNVSMKMVD